MWSLIYLGPPEYLLVNRGTAFTSKEFKKSLEAFDVRLEEAQIETSSAIGAAEWYCAPLRLAFEKFRVDTDRETSYQDCLQLLVFAVNRTMSPEGLCPTRLVFCTIPRPAIMTPAPLQMQKSRLIDGTM